MIEEQQKVLRTQVLKLYNRGAQKNIKNIFAKTHSADIAALIQDLEPLPRYELFVVEKSIEKRAEILSHLSENAQRELLEMLSRQQVLDLVGRMEKDDAADLLGHLPEDEAKEILASMVREDSEEVAGLMGYPEDSAGGLMISDLLAVNQDTSVKDTISSIQQQDNESMVTFYVYAVNDNDQLVGVVSLKQLLLSRPEQKIKEVMTPDVISASLETNQQEVAKMVERYDFLSLPVVDQSQKLVGVITVDDVIDVIREEAEEDLLAMGRAGWGVNVSTFEHMLARLPWLCLAYVGGCLAFILIYYFTVIKTPIDDKYSLWVYAAFLPLILAMGSTTGSQAATVAVGAIRAGKFDLGKVSDHLKKEVKLSFVFAMVFGLITFLLGLTLFNEYPIQLITSLASAMGLQIVIAVIIGANIPVMMHKMHWDPTIASVPLFTTLTDLMAVTILFAFVHAIAY